MDSRLDLADSRLDSIEKVVSNLDEERKRDRKENLDVLDTKQTEVQLNEHISWKQTHTRKRQLPTLSRDSTAPGKEKIQRQG